MLTFILVNVPWSWSRFLASKVTETLTSESVDGLSTCQDHFQLLTLVEFLR